jgi:DNA polymerase II small subunit/DNA polymerase delta subunit B
MEGFEIFCWDIVGCVEDYFKNTNKAYEEYSPICSRIRKEIREDQITGGMVGQYNASITQRLNNLKEQVEQNVTETKIINLGNGINPNE